MKNKSSFDNGLRLRILTRHQAPALVRHSPYYLLERWM